MKRVVVVDHDVDIFDDRQMTWAIATRCQPDRDITIITNARGSARPVGGSGRLLGQVGRRRHRQAVARRLHAAPSRPPTSTSASTSRRSTSRERRTELAGGTGHPVAVRWAELRRPAEGPRGGGDPTPPRWPGRRRAHVSRLQRRAGGVARALAARGARAGDVIALALPIAGPSWPHFSAFSKWARRWRRSIHCSRRRSGAVTDILHQGS